MHARSSTRAVPPASHPGAAGYTLVEMMIALVLLGIMTSISAPFFLKDRPEAEVRNAANRLANDIRQARFRAISLKRDVYFAVEPNGLSDFYTAYADIDDDGSATGTTAEVQAVRMTTPDARSGLQGVQLPAAVTFDLGDASSSADPDATAPSSELDLPQNPIVFEPRGTVRWPSGSTAASAGVYVNHTDHSDLVYAVILMPTGVVKVWEYQDGEWR